MRPLIFIFLFFSCVECAFAQTPAIDSIDHLIDKASSDTAKINLVINKLNLLARINLDSAITLGKKTLEKAQRIKYYEGEIKVMLSLSKSYCFKGNYKAAAANLQYLEHFIKPSKDSTDFSDVYAVNGMLYGMQARYDSAIYFYNKAIGINERSDNKKSLALNYSNIAISYQQQSNFSQALYYQQKALKVAEAQNDEISMAYTYTNLGTTYDYMDDSDRAERAYLKAAQLAKKKDLDNIELYVFSNLSSLYMNGKNWIKTYNYAIEAAKLAEAMGDQGSQAGSLSNAAIALANTSQFDKALSLAKKSLVIADSSEQPLKIFQAYLSLGTLFKLQGNYREAITNFEKSAFSLKDADIYTSATGQLYEDLAECYEKTGNYNKALQLYKTYAQIKDSVRSKDNIQKATELTLNYEFNKKQEVAAAEQEKQNAVVHARQLALIIGLCFCVVLAIVLIIGLKNKYRANYLLKKQKAEIQTTLTQLKSTQAQLIQSEKMASLGELTSGIAHEIQNPLNFINNFSDVNRELLIELKDEAVKGNVDQITAIADDVIDNEEKINFHGKRADAIVKGMLQHSRKTSGQKELTDINILCDEYLRLSYHACLSGSQGLRAKDKSFSADLKTNFDASIGNIDIVPQDIGRVLLNLFNNAFYATNEKKKNADVNYKPLVSVQTKKIKNKVEISVHDNGNGIPQNIIDKIFQPFFTTKPTGQGTGLGLSLSYTIITEEHGGTLKVESQEGKGTTLTIQLPVS